MKRMLVPLLLGLFLTLSACKPAADTPPPTAVQPPAPTPVISATPTPTPAPTASAAPAPVWGEQTLSVAQPHPDKPEVTLVSGDFTLPLIENAAGVRAYESINDWYTRLLEALKADTMGYVAQATDDYETATALGEGFSGYSDEETFEVLYETETLVSILRTHYAHSDGPYPTLLYMADRFDLTTGQPLNFADFFTDPEKAAQIALSEVKGKGAASSEPVFDLALMESAFHREYFYPTADGFVFYYQPQVLTPLAAFMPTFTVPYTAFEGLLAR